MSELLQSLKWWHIIYSVWCSDEYRLYKNCEINSSFLSDVLSTMVDHTSVTFYYLLLLNKFKNASKKEKNLYRVLVGVRSVIGFSWTGILWESAWMSIQYGCQTGWFWTAGLVFHPCWSWCLQPWQVLQLCKCVCDWPPTGQILIISWLSLPVLLRSYWKCVYT